MVHGGTALFTLIGFMGIDFIIGLAFLWLVSRELSAGPGTHPHGATPPEAAHG
jgi:cytochrome bd-type quinol oxidase subunit 1